MLKITVNGAELHYSDTGSGAETILFAHGLLWSGRMFDEQVAALRQRYRCIALDFRGQGQSEVTKSGYDMDTLTEDAATLIGALDVAPCHFLGLSMGGFIGLRLAARRPELVKTLMLLETTADAEPKENVWRYKLLASVARWLGVGLVGGKVMPIMFGQKFLTDPSRAEQRQRFERQLMANHRVGTYRATMGVVNRLPIVEEIHRVRVPTLVVVGDQDVATTPAKARRIHERIPGSRLLVIPGAGHSSCVEEPAAVNAALLQFLDDVRRGALVGQK